jgi:hypothetical protein
MPAGFKQPLGWWVIIIGLNLALSVWVPRIDSAAHGGGFIAGLLVTGIIVGAQDRLPLPRPNSLSRVLPALLLMGVAIGGLADAARNYMNPDPRAFVKAVEPWVGAPNLFPDELNRYAWEVGTDGGTDEPALRRAREAAERAMDEVTSDLAGMDPRDPQIQALKSARLSAYGDTRATLLYRLGELDQAIEVERSVLEREAEDTEAAGEPSNEGFYATQLARFMRAKNRRDRPPAEARLWIPDGGNAIAYEMAAASEKPVTLYAVAETGGRLEGLVRIPAAAGTFTGTVAVELPWKHASIELGTISPAEHAPRVWPADPEALKLP